MSRWVALVGIVVVMALLSACKIDPASQTRPARIVAPTAESRAELERVVATALRRADVTLADDALTGSSVLSVAPKPVRDAQNNQIMGRDLGTPAQFLLLKQDGKCVLELRGSDQRWVLTATTCVDE